jgi:hypothetical protein
MCRAALLQHRVVMSDLPHNTTRCCTQHLRRSALGNLPAQPVPFRTCVSRAGTKMAGGAAGTPGGAAGAPGGAAGGLMALLCSCLAPPADANGPSGTPANATSGPGAAYAAPAGGVSACSVAGGCGSQVVSCTVMMMCYKPRLGRSIRARSLKWLPSRELCCGVVRTSRGARAHPGLGEAPRHAATASSACVA